jgi:paraquat-inducible protein B
LGLFVMGAIAALAITVLAIGQRAVKKTTITYHTYFNESVQGLEIGAPVKYRGVMIGSVSDIQVAPDHRHVDVVEELSVNEIRRMGLTEGGSNFIGQPRFKVPSDLRAQLGTQGITGVRYILIDFFNEESNPVPELPFEVPRNYIPAASSLMKDLEDTLVKTLERLPTLEGSLEAILVRVDAILADFQNNKLSDRASDTLARVNTVLADMRGVVQQIAASRLPEKGARAMDDADVAATKLNQILDRIDGPNGLVASLQLAARDGGRDRVQQDREHARTGHEEPDARSR